MKQTVLHKAHLVLAILIVVCFQLFWLKDNYDREHTAVILKTKSLFKQIVYDAQTGILNNFKTTINKKDISSVILNAISDFSTQKNYNNTIINLKKGKFKVIFSDKDGENNIDTSNLKTGNKLLKTHANSAILIATGIDSLLQSISAQAIESTLTKRLAAEKIEITFTVIKTNLLPTKENDEKEIIQLGSSNNTKMVLEINSKSKYLIRKMIFPFLWSMILLLIVITAIWVLNSSLKKQRSFAKQKNDFINHVTHELNTPISTIKVALEAISNFDKETEFEKTNEYLQIAKNQTDKLSFMVEEILNTSHLQHLHQKKIFEAIDLKNMLTQVLEEIELLLNEKEATVNIDAPEKELIIMGNAIQLNTAFKNIIQNGLKYNKGNPNITIKLWTEAHQMFISFTDNGIGIDKKDFQLIFQQFYRVQNEAIHTYKGYGLGLYAVKNILQLHNAKIIVNSKLGLGSSFVISFKV